MCRQCNFVRVTRPDIRVLYITVAVSPTELSAFILSSSISCAGLKCSGRPHYKGFRDILSRRADTDPTCVVCGCGVPVCPTTRQPLGAVCVTGEKLNVVSRLLDGQPPGPFRPLSVVVLFRLPWRLLRLPRLWAVAGQPGSRNRTSCK